MACEITLGRLEGCKDQVGGLAAIYFINYGAAGGWTAGTDGDISAPVTATPAAFKYDLRGTSTFEQSLTSSRENGTTYAEQTLTVSLKSQDSTTHKEVKLLAYGRPHIIIEDNNGKLWVMGAEHGAEMTATTSSGAAMGDKTGYELTFASMEKELAPFFSGDIDASFTITVGA